MRRTTLHQLFGALAVTLLAALAAIAIGESTPQGEVVAIAAQQSDSQWG
ncbi:hypothetical protein [Streptomyces antarcticus]|nr:MULTISPECIES: hypothetical protein [unclassified Streptomyces]MCY0946614.1 hypothetical protein [Streptomyces sp. H34-AA3]MCZ4085694.1 hypothetical protein [Streptomyces sp. H34-S5]